MKKVLVIGLGRQGKKYLSYFQNKGYEIFGVTKSGETDIVGIEVFSFSSITEKKSSFFEDFHCIIVSVFPISEQEKVIKLLLEKNTRVPCIIEKPVCDTRELRERLVTMENVSFFVDEIVFHTLYGKIFPSMENTTVFLSEGLKDNEKKHILQHVFGGFLLHEAFDTSKVKICYVREISSDYTHYKISSGKYCLEFKKSQIYLSSKKIGELFFSQSIEKIEDIIFGNADTNTLYKKNFVKLLEQIG